MPKVEQDGLPVIDAAESETITVAPPARIDAAWRPGGGAMTAPARSR